jgi:superfamily II DNA or RNA helicase
MTVISPKLGLNLVGTPAVVHARKIGDIPRGFWLQLISQWGAAGDQPGQKLVLGIDQLLSGMSSLRRACERYGVGIDWQPELRQLVAEHQAQRRSLNAVFANLSVLTDEEVHERLQGSRFSRELRTFQVRDLGHLLALPHGANFSVPGAGKTTVAYAAYEAERVAGRVEQMLVVAPLSAFDAWTTGADECFPPDTKPVVSPFANDVDPDAEVVVVNYHRLDSRYEALAAWVSQRPTLVLLDEAHRMKRGWDGTFGTACLSIAFLAARRDVLTGTPAPQGPRDMIALMDFLWPGQAQRILPREALVNPPPADAGHLVASSISPVFARTRKSELGLRPPNLQVIEVAPDPLQVQIYEALKDQYAGAFKVNMNDRAALARMGEIVMYLLEAATNPRLLSAGSASTDDITFRHPPLDIPPGSSLWQLLQEYNQYETPAKFRQLAQLVHNNATEGRKTLIWTNFVRNIHALERMLAVYQPAAVYGGIPSEVSDPSAARTREGELSKFRDRDSGCMVLIANPAAMSEGVSLHQVCNDAVYLDRTFNAGQYLQSLDRIHRLGLGPDVITNISFLLTTGTIDEVIDIRIREKALRLGEMLDDPDLTTMALPSDDDYGPAIETDDDLVALFAHLRGDH